MATKKDLHSTLTRASSPCTGGLNVLVNQEPGGEDGGGGGVVAGTAPAIGKAVLLSTAATVAWAPRASIDSSSSFSPSGTPA